MTITTSQRSVEDALFWLLDQLKERQFDRRALTMSVVSVLSSEVEEFEVMISGRVSWEGT